MISKSKHHVPRNAITVLAPYTIEECLAILSDLAADKKSPSTTIIFKPEVDKHTPYHARFTMEKHVEINRRSFRKERLTGMLVHDRESQMTRLIARVAIPSHEAHIQVLGFAVLFSPCALLMFLCGQETSIFTGLFLLLLPALALWYWWEFSFTVVNDPQRYELADQVQKALRWGKAHDA